MGKNTRDRDKWKAGSTDSVPLLSRLEWDELLTAKDADQRLEDLATSGALRATFPSIQRMVGFGGVGSGHKDLWDHTKRVVAQTIPRPLLRWAALFHDCGKPVTFSRATGEITFRGHEQVSASIFKRSARASGLFRSEEIARVATIIRLLGRLEQYDAEWTESAVRRLGVELGELADDVLALARADCTSGNPTMRRRAHERCHELKTRLAKVKEQDRTPAALPRGLGNAVMARLGFQATGMTHEQQLEMARVMGNLKAAVESGELPRSAQVSLYMEKLETML